MKITACVAAALSVLAIAAAGSDYFEFHRSPTENDNDWFVSRAETVWTQPAKATRFAVSVHGRGVLTSINVAERIIHLVGTTDKKEIVCLLDGSTFSASHRWTVGDTMRLDGGSADADSKPPEWGHLKQCQVVDISQMYGTVSNSAWDERCSLPPDRPYDRAALIKYCQAPAK